VVFFHIRSSEGGSPLQQALIMYRCIRAIWIPVNLVASMVTELDDTLHRFMDDLKG
jgi:hypothetical protein